MRIRLTVALAVFALLACAPADAQRAAFERRSLTHDGATRVWHEIIPSACTRPGSRCGLVVFLHGGGGLANGAQLAERVGMAQAAPARGYILLAPDALGDNWNDGRPELAAGIDDVGFIRAMLAHVGRRAGIDPLQVYATGASNGGLMSFRLACEAADTFRAVAPVIAHMSVNLIDACRPSRPVSVFMIAGTEDELMPYGGGPVAARYGRRGSVVSSDRTLEFWRTALECREPPLRRRFDPVRDATAVAITRYEGCRGTAIVQRWAVEGGGHSWPGTGGAGARGRLGRRMFGTTATEFSATDVILGFFVERGRPR